jgi:hypothetical protein
MLFNLQTVFLLTLALLATTVPTVAALPGLRQRYFSMKTLAPVT